MAREVVRILAMYVYSRYGYSAEGGGLGSR